MSILLIMVYGLVGLISGALGYYFNQLQLFFVVFASFLIYSIIQQYKKWFMIVLGLFIASSIGLMAYYIYNENFEIIAQPIRNFMNVYYYSVILEGYYIDHSYQALLIGLVSLLLFFIYHFFYRRKRLQWIPMAIGFIFAISAFLLNTLTSVKDQYAFIVFLMTCIIYYFALYSVRISQVLLRKEKYMFYGMGTVFALGIIGFGLIFHHYRPNPFEEKVQTMSVGINDEESNAQTREYESSIVQDISDGLYSMQSSFEHEGVAVFSVKADTLKYYVTDSYDIYEKGVWSRSSQVQDIASDILDEHLYEQETIKVTYENIRSNRLLLSPRWENINISEDMQSLLREEDVIQKGFHYSIDAIIPRYRTIAFEEAIIEHQEEESIEGFVELAQADEEIRALALDITRDATTDYENARLIENYLSTEYSYNERPEYDLSKDMIHEFLFEAKEGFCQQFASSMVLMMRSIGIPSRFVVGYVLNIESYDDIPDSLMYAYGEVPEEKTIYDYNAHAWVESYFPGVGWVQFEPTAGQSFYAFYDPQAMEFEASNEELQGNTMSNQSESIVKWSVFVFLLLVLGMLLGVLLKRRQTNYKNNNKRLYNTYNILLLYLDKCTYGKCPGETLREYAQRIQKELPTHQIGLKDFLETLEKAFYNKEVPDIEHVKSFEKYLIQIKKVAKRRMHYLTYQKIRFIEAVIYFR